MTGGKPVRQYHLDTTTTLTPASWQRATNLTTIVNAQNVVSVQAQGPFAVFRLSR